MRSSVSQAMTIGLTSALIVVAAAAIILLTTNITIINAQQFTNQPGEATQNRTTATAATTILFQSTNDSFKVRVPQGWVIDDVNNTGFTLAAEVTNGYGVLAQLCQERGGGGRQQQQQAPIDVSNSSSSSCQQPTQDEIIYIIRYPNLDATVQQTLGVNDDDDDKTNIDNLLSYQLQKLQQVGYKSIETVNNTDTTVNVMDPLTNQIIQTVPARLVEMTYSTASAPNVIREGYFMLTATNATAPNPGITKGYSVFYEGDSTATNAASIVQTKTTSGNLLPLLPAPVRQVFDSFELIAAEEAAQTGGGGITTTIDDCDNTTTTTIDDVDDNIEGTTIDNDNDTTTTTTIDDCDNTTTTTIDDDIGGGGGTTTTTTTIDDDNDTTTTIDDDIGGGTEPTEPFTAEIISNGTQGVAPATVEFEADVTEGTTPYNYHWDFDEDEDSVERDDDGTISHTFEEAGTYDVTLTVTGSSGQRASDSVEITVQEPATAAAEEEVNMDDEEQQPITIEQPLTVDITSSDTEEGEESTTSANQDNNGNGGDNTGPSIEGNDNHRKDENNDGKEQKAAVEEEKTLCDSSYPDVCIAAPPPNLDCDDDGVPENFKVLSPDPHEFDSDNDGIGCESGSNHSEVEPESSKDDDEATTTTTVDRTSSDDNDDNTTTDEDDSQEN